MDKTFEQNFFHNPPLWKDGLSKPSFLFCINDEQIIKCSYAIMNLLIINMNNKNMNKKLPIYKIKLSSGCDYAEEQNIIDISDIQGTNCYLDDEARLEIKRKVRDIPTEAIHFIDSGNYHYMSLLFLERIKEPFDLIVFDNHTDYQESAFGGLTSCGGWIREANDIFSNLNKIYMIGTDPGLAASERFSDKVELVNWKTDAKTDTDTETKTEDKTEANKEDKIECKTEGKIEVKIEGKTEAIVDNKNDKRVPVYISIDKDVLSEECYKANWSQGTMTVNELISSVTNIMDRCDVIGIDICGGTGDENDTAGNAINREADQAILAALI